MLRELAGDLIGAILAAPIEMFFENFIILPILYAIIYPIKYSYNTFGLEFTISLIYLIYTIYHYHNLDDGESSALKRIVINPAYTILKLVFFANAVIPMAIIYSFQEEQQQEDEEGGSTKEDLVSNGNQNLGKVKTRSPITKVLIWILAISPLLLIYYYIYYQYRGRDACNQYYSCLSGCKTIGGQDDCISHCSESLNQNYPLLYWESSIMSSQEMIELNECIVQEHCFEIEETQVSECLSIKCEKSSGNVCATPHEAE